MRFGRPSPALFISILALVISMSGVSYAAVLIGTNNIKNGAVTTKKIKNGTIRKLDIAPGTVAALKGQQGPAGSAKAYAVVNNSGPALLTARSKGFATVTRPATGVYCLNLSDATIDSSTLAPVVGVDWDNSSGANLNAFASLSANGCPAGTDVGVKTYTWTAGGNNTASNSVAFVIAVP
jgi:hypothetical protein